MERENSGVAQNLQPNTKDAQQTQTPVQGGAIPRPQGAPMGTQGGAMPRPQGAPMGPQGQVAQRPQGAPMGAQGGAMPRPQGAPMQQQGGVAQRPQGTPMGTQGGAMPRPQGAPMQQQGGVAQRPQGAPMGAQGQRQAPSQQRPNAEQAKRQAVVRMFEPDMHDLKQTIRTLSEKPNTKTSLYGQSGEVLLAIQTPGLQGQEAAKHAANIAADIEKAMGISAYGRDRQTLTMYAVKALSDNGYKIAAPDEETGRILEQEFGPIEISHDVFDFGEKSYYNTKMADKILDAALLDDEESTDAAQLASDRSYAAKKCMKTTFGVAIASSANGEEIGVAVTYGKTVYVRRIENSQNAAKAASLTLMDMLRLLCGGQIIPYAKVFHAGDELDWDDPLPQKGDLNSTKGKGKPQKESKGNLVLPVIVLSLVAIALVLAILYIYNTFIIDDNSAIAVANGNSVEQSIDAETQSTLSQANSQVSQGQATGDNDEGVVHPFSP